MSKPPETLFMFQRHNREKWYGYPWRGNDDDIEYVRADTIDTLRARAEAAEARVKAMEEALKSSALALYRAADRLQEAAKRLPDSNVKSIVDDWACKAEIAADNARAETAEARVKKMEEVIKKAVAEAKSNPKYGSGGMIRYGVLVDLIAALEVKDK